MARQGFINENAGVLLDAVTTGTGRALDARGCQLLTAYSTGNGTTSGGTVLIETAPVEGYTGTWSTAATLTASDVSGNKTKGTALPIGAYNYVRARVSSNITGGGTITVVLSGL